MNNVDIILLYIVLIVNGNRLNIKNKKKERRAGKK